LPVKTAADVRDDRVAQAALTASNTAQRIDQAELELELGLVGRDLGSIDKAIKLRPRDPTYRLYKASMQIAQGESPDEAAGNALALIQASLPEVPTARQERVFVEGFLGALSKTSESFPADSNERQRLERQYCYTFAIYKQTYNTSAVPSPSCQ
jgi:hypothetical protein